MKHIGLEDNDFQLRIDNDVAGRTVSLPGPINYFIFRVYETARQLHALDHSALRHHLLHANKAAVVIIDHDAWFRFDLGFGSINWKNPEFLTGADEQWNAFIAGQSGKYTELPNDLAETICSLDSIWLILQSSDFSFSEKFINVNPRIA